MICNVEKIYYNRYLLLAVVLNGPNSHNNRYSMSIVHHPYLSLPLSSLCCLPTQVDGRGGLAKYESRKSVGLF